MHALPGLSQGHSPVALASRFRLKSESLAQFLGRGKAHSRDRRGEGEPLIAWIQLKGQQAVAPFIFSLVN